MEGLQICPSSEEITSVENVSWNTDNEWNEVNCTEELKGKYQKFCPNTWNGKVKRWGCNDMGGMNLCEGMTIKGEKCMMSSIKMVMDEKNDSRSWMRWMTLGHG